MFEWEKWSRDDGKTYAWDTAAAAADRKVESAIKTLLRQCDLIRAAGATYEQTPMDAWLAATDLVIDRCALEEASAILREGPAAFERYEALRALERS